MIHFVFYIFQLMIYNGCLLNIGIDNSVAFFLDVFIYADVFDYYEFMF